MAIIEPQLLKGTRDFGPEEMGKRLFIINKMRKVFASFGYDPIETPALEYAKTVLGKYGDEGDKLTYTFKDHGGRTIALRYDQTVPTARFVAANQGTIEFPFKRYQIGPVWRADKPQRGRYREFYQCDIDIIGSDSLLADAEIAKVIYSVLAELGLKKFYIRLNSRKLLDAILDTCQIKQVKRIEVIRIIDKLDKVGLNKVKRELNKHLSKDQVKQLVSLALDEKITNQLKHLDDSEGKQEMTEILQYLKTLGVPNKNIKLDLTLARGLDYYTGVIYEVVTDDLSLGSICGGGRYDDLTGLFSTKKYPGTGIAFGLDRIMVYMEEKGLLKNLKRNTQVLVANFPDTLKENLELANDLQKAGINTEMYLNDASLKKQFKYADKKVIPWMIIQGSEEIKKKKVALRNMVNGKQEYLTVKQVLKKLTTNI